MGSLGDKQLHVFFFPFMAHGHTIPAVDMAKLFASRGVKASIITTPVNAPLFSRTIERTKRELDIDIEIKTIRFPAPEVGLPEGCENFDVVESLENGTTATGLLPKFVKATWMLQDPLEKLLEEIRPDCIVADSFFPWATEAASKFGIPRLIFHGTSFFSLSASKCIEMYEPLKRVSSDSEPFIVPNLPGEIKFTKKQFPDEEKKEQLVYDGFAKLFAAAKESEARSFGVIVNSFYELEPTYADFYRNFLGRRAWHIGPVSLCNRGIEDKAQRGKQAAISDNECLKWLDSKKPGSVIYICFGSVSSFTTNQLMQIAIALESSGQEFIWVVRKGGNKLNGGAACKEDWLPEGFEERMEGKGLIIRGWAPQVLILDHAAVGGFVTHCGWNSTLEGITAGKPLITWPLFAEQFLNEKLVTEVLRIGVGVGVKEWVMYRGDFVRSVDIEKAISRLMVGEEAQELRSRAKKMGELARKAVDVGGSSFSDFNSLVNDLRCYRTKEIGGRGGWDFAFVL